MKNRMKTAGLLVVAMGLSLALTGCGEVKVNLEVGDSLPEEFNAYNYDNDDVNSTVTIDNVDYTIDDPDVNSKDWKKITVTISGSYTYINEDELLTYAPKMDVQLVDKKGNVITSDSPGAVSIAKKEVGEAYESEYTFFVDKSGTYTVKLAESKD